MNKKKYVVKRSLSTCLSPWIFCTLAFIITAFPVNAQQGNQPETQNLFWPPAPAETRIRFVESFTSPEDMGLKKRNFGRVIRDLLTGRVSRSLVRPYGIFIGADGESIYITDPGAGAFHLYDRKKNRYRKLTNVKGVRLRSPIDVAMDPKGRLFISDSELASVFVLNQRLKLLTVLGPAENLQRPTGVYYWKGRLFVVDTLGNNIVVYDENLDFLFGFGTRGTGNGEFNYPTGITVSSDDRVYINDSMNFRIQEFDMDGDFVRSFGHPGDSSGSFNRSKGLSTDSDGNLYVVDALFETVQMFDSAGTFLMNFGESGEDQGQFWMPSGIAIDSDDRIYVADSYNSRIQVFQYVKGGANHE